MELTIKIKLDNDAYQVGMETELREHFESVISKINQDDASGILFDSNGNKTGWWDIEIDEEQ